MEYWIKRLELLAPHATDEDLEKLLEEAAEQIESNHDYEEFYLMVMEVARH